MIVEPDFRFIPAGAGNTVAIGRVRAADTVHPRWRGEHYIKKRIKLHITGSSPLARGTRDGLRPGALCWRFIPAGAGNTRCTLAGSHPTLGSSPLARGTQEKRQDYDDKIRFIPAGAGNTSA